MRAISASSSISRSVSAWPPEIPPSVASLLELRDDLGGRLGADVGVDQRLLEPLPRLVAEILEQRRLDLGGERLAGLAEVLAQPAEHAPPPLLGLRRLLGSGRPARLAVDDEQVSAIRGPRGARLAVPRPASAACLFAGGSRREITFEMPSAPIDTPYSESAASIVRFWWVTTMNWACPE